MNKHQQIRQRILETLRGMDGAGSITFCDGRPAFIDAETLPVLAVYLTDARATPDLLDGDSWQAVLHLEIFISAEEPDSALDEWIETLIYPALDTVDNADGLVTSIIPQGYDYQRDQELATWGSADLTCLINYDLQGRQHGGTHTGRT